MKLGLGAISAGALPRLATGSMTSLSAVHVSLRLLPVLFRLRSGFPGLLELLADFRSVEQPQ